MIEWYEQSVGALCTLVLVAIADVVIGSQGLSLSTLIGCGLIVGAFAVLLGNTLRGGEEKASGEKGRLSRRVSMEGV